MSAKPITLVVSVAGADDRLVPTVRWVDGQDLPYADYDVIYVDHTGRTDEARLAELYDRRPNALVVNADDIDGPPIDQARGEYVLVIAGEDRLQPWGLRTLLERAQQTSADLVLGRSAGLGPIGFVPEVLRRPWKNDDAEAAIAVLAPIALIRTELLRSVLGSSPVADGWRTLRLRILGAANTVEVVNDPPVAVGPGPGASESIEETWADVDDASTLIPQASVRAEFLAAHAAATLRRTPESKVATEIATVVRRHLEPGPDLPPTDRPAASELLNALIAETPEAAIAVAGAHPSVRVDCESAQWVDGQLTLSIAVEVRPSAGADVRQLAEVTPDLLLRHPADSVVYAVPTSVRRSADDTAVSYRLDATVDPATSAAGAKLSRGQWQLLVRLLGTDSDAPTTANVPFCDPGAAIIDGLPIRPYAEKNGFRFDVGATRHGIFGGSVPKDATITESAAGSLLRVNFPRIAVRGESRSTGSLLMGKFPLPSELITDADGARLECFVSGLASVSPLSGRYPPAMEQPLGLQVRIGAAGDISVEKVEPVGEKPAPKPAAAAPNASATKKTAATKPAAAKKPAPAVTKPAAQKSASEQHAGATSYTYPTNEPSALQQLAINLKPAGRLLPKPIRRRARKAYRKLIR